MSVCSDFNELLSGEIKDLSFDLGIRPSSIYIAINLGESNIKDHIINSIAFPNIFKGSFLTVEFDDFPQNKLKMTSGDTTIVVFPKSLFTILNTFIDAILKEVDVTKYLNDASETTGKILEKGDRYLKDVLKTGTQQSIILDFSLKAPLIIIPSDINSLEKPIIIADLGTLSSKNDLANYDGLDFDVYKLMMKPIRISTV